MLRLSIHNLFKRSNTRFISLIKPPVDWDRWSKGTLAWWTFYVMGFYVPPGARGVELWIGSWQLDPSPGATENCCGFTLAAGAYNINVPKFNLKWRYGQRSDCKEACLNRCAPSVPFRRFCWSFSFRTSSYRCQCCKTSNAGAKSWVPSCYVRYRWRDLLCPSADVE